MALIAVASVLDSAGVSATTAGGSSNATCGRLEAGVTGAAGGGLNALGSARGSARATETGSTAGAAGVMAGLRSRTEP